MSVVLKVVLWGSVSAVAALLVRRRQQRKAAPVNVGSVSEEWLASQHRVTDPY